ncbi:GHMP family kinase ATP-binding protein [Nitrospina watsonii]|uniref:D,D-heptose 7-phosphate kinase n=1 Tax=Nitrospina watsonii TaxID=1323948 RepID=A0ABM9HG10_9BACT|nr:GHMP kinase [Nitrospina watsonii]CAI2719155.1 D,D-heptose 7-phosphate kinase [Nitrospina watsonii]
MIDSSAPTRIDLAGSTLDLWPLHLFFDNPPTLNAAIDLYARVQIRPRADRKLVIESRDLKQRATFANLQRLPASKHPLELILRLVKFYTPQKGLEIVTHCAAPAGSGIGGSSALNIALNGALNRFTGRAYRRERMIEIAKNIETQVINVPAGTQDYYAAMYGGVQAVQPYYDRLASHPIPLDLADATRRFVLCYTGKPRNSGINNWTVYQQTINGKASVQRNLQRIAGLAVKMETVLRKKQWGRFGELFAEEWQARRALAPGIATPEMDALMRAAKRHGAQAAKVCGAGGGGCIALFVAPERKDDVAQALQNLNGRVLDFRFVRRGLVVKSD